MRNAPKVQPEALALALRTASIERVLPRRVSFGRYTAEVTWTELGKALQEMPVAA